MVVWPGTVFSQTLGLTWVHTCKTKWLTDLLKQSKSRTQWNLLQKINLDHADKPGDSRMTSNPSNDNNCITYKASLCYVKLILPGRDPNAATVDCKEAWLTLKLLRPESCTEFVCYLLNRGLSCCGYRLGCMDYGLEKAALFKHHIVCNAYLGTNIQENCSHQENIRTV